MGYISTKKALIQSQLTQVQTQLEALYGAMAEMSLSGVQSYAFDSGEGSQRTTRRPLADILESIKQLEATQDHLINKLYGMGLVAVQLRRRHC